MTKICFILLVNIAPAQYISKATQIPIKLKSFTRKKDTSALIVKSFFNYLCSNTEDYIGEYFPIVKTINLPQLASIKIVQYHQIIGKLVFEVTLRQVSFVRIHGHIYGPQKKQCFKTETRLCSRLQLCQYSITNKRRIGLRIDAA